MLAMVYGLKRSAIFSEREGARPLSFGFDYSLLVSLCFRRLAYPSCKSWKTVDPFIKLMGSKAQLRQQPRAVNLVGSASHNHV